jgi:mannose-6-phosphate isomerase-like protein (cupin superfamily)
MAIVLEGGCRVTDMREGSAMQSGTLRVWPQIGRQVGAQAISLRVLEFSPGVSPGWRNENCEEILYLPNSGEASATNAVNETVPLANVFIEGRPHAVGPATGIYLRLGQTLTVANPGSESLVMISSQCPEPLDASFKTTLPMTCPPPSSLSPDRSPIVRLADRPALPIADRWYRVLVDDEAGSTQVTQFVGSIPPGRAPDHFHNYEEVLFILRGAGRMWAGETHTPIGEGSCVYLPRGQVHCVENTGDDELRLLGVFYPAGSPSVRYEVD